MLKRKICLLGVFFALFALSACRNKESFKLLHPESEISGISIVALSFDTDENLTQTEIQTINDIGSFLEDFRNIDCYTYFGDPAGITEPGTEATVIKIIYVNNEYDLINWNGQAEYRSERGLIYYAGFSVFDQEDFSNLIERYC